MKPRIVITGIGLQTPLNTADSVPFEGDTAAEFFHHLCEGGGTFKPHPSPALRALNLPLAWVDFDASAQFSKMQLLGLDRVSQLAIVAALHAMRSAGLPTDTPLGKIAGLYFGTGGGGVESTEHAYAKFFDAGGAQKKILTVPAAMVHAPASQVALHFDIQGE